MLRKIATAPVIGGINPWNADATNEKYRINQVVKRNIKMIRRENFPDLGFCLLKIFRLGIGILILMASDCPKCNNIVPEELKRVEFDSRFLRLFQEIVKKSKLQLPIKNSAHVKATKAMLIFISFTTSRLIYRYF